jgi:geranylgeranyl pyrophosphate synthase
MRPSLPLALLHERVRSDAQERALVEKAWRKECSREELEQIENLFVEYNISERCKVLQESYKEQAIRCLGELDNASVKGLLRRVISKIFTIEVKDWCSEFETRNAAGREISA